MRYLLIILFCIKSLTGCSQNNSLAMQKEMDQDKAIGLFSDQLLPLSEKNLRIVN